VISRKKYWLSALLIIVVAASSVVQLTKNKNWTIEKYYSQKLNWSDCYSGFECATFLVPVDYEKIDSQNFKLKTLRHLASDNKNRIGTLVVNPGGPGGSATDYAFNAESIVSSDIYQKYDIVGFDPRGINGSEPIRCLSNAEEDEFLNATATSGNSEEIAKLVATSKGFAEKCAKVAGSKLGHYSTLETAKDLEVLRRILNEGKLNYLGKSYGTYLGTLYAALYPNSVGKFVLDGAVAPNISLRDQEIAQAIGFGSALNAYLKKNNQFSRDDILKLIAKSKVEPLKTLSGRALTQSLIVTAIAQSLYNSKTGWPELTNALERAITKNKPAGLLKLADEYNNRDSAGNFYSNQNDISIMVTCLDWSEDRSLADMSNDQSEFAKLSPVFGPYLNFAGLPCKYWQAKPQLPKVSLTKIDTSPLLIIGVTDDPATPYKWAQSLAKTFTNSTLVTLKGEGHTGHNRGNKCVDLAVDSYFLAGKIPQNPLICAQSGN
jgi:pimeloyl-ACP methyl ester carboxylesterase